MEAYILLTALRDCNTSLARMRATSLLPCLAASLSDFSTLASSRLIAEGGGGDRGRCGEVEGREKKGEGKAKRGTGEMKRERGRGREVDVPREISDTLMER